MRWNPLRRAACFGWRWALVLVVPAATAQVRLNEIVSSNGGSLRDASGGTPDWIELYNAGSTSVNLAGYGLSDREDNPFKWVFPPQVLAPGAYLIVWASGRDQREGELHTNFSLAREGEVVVLTSPGGEREVAPATRLRRDVSWGRDLQTGEWRYFPTPTPGRANTGPSFVEILHEAPEVSPPGGFYEQETSLSLSLVPPGSVVRYTTDGAEPDETSPVWTGTLTLRDRSGEEAVLAWIQGTSTVNQHTDGWKPPLGPVRLAHVLRWRAFKPGALPSPVMTHTYFIGPSAWVVDGLPVVSLVSPPRGLFDEKEGIYMLGQVFVDYVAAHPNEPLTGHTPANYTQRGSVWARSASVEFFEPEGTRAFAVPARLDIKGQSSRSFRQKSFGLDFNTEGQEALSYPLFPRLRRSGDGSPLTTFETIRLRNFGNDWAYAAMRDAFCHQLALGMGLDVMAWRPVSIFLNGEYWGVLEAREQQDAAYFKAHYGVEPEDLALLNGDGSVIEGTEEDRQAYLALRAYAEAHDLSQPEAFAYVAARMDVENFLRYQLAEVFFGNADWPHNNTRLWRHRRPGDFAEPETAPPGHDGRWRWMLFDLDLAAAHPWAGGVGENTLAFAMSPTGRPGAPSHGETILLRSLLQNPEVKARFASLAADWLNSHFKASRATAVLEEMAAQLRPAWPEHFRRWNLHGGMLSGWQSHYQVLRTWASQREVNVRQHVTIQLSLGGYAMLTVDCTPEGGGQVQVNQLRLDEALPGAAAPIYPWRGMYFRQVPVTLTAHPAPGFVFEKWLTPEGEETTPQLTLTLTSSTQVTAHFWAQAPAESLAWRTVARTPEGGLLLELQGVPGAAYELRRSLDLQHWVWERDFTTDSAGAAALTLPPPLPAALFLQAHQK